MSDNAVKSTITHTEFGQLFIQYKPRFISVAYGYVRDTMVAEDIVVDSFISFWENRGRVAENTNILAYIMTSVKNRCLNWLRSENIHLRAKREIYSEKTRVLQANIRSLEMCNPDRLFADEVAQIIEREVGAMPEITRKILLGNRFFDKTYNEIATEHGISVRSVEYEIQKALKILRTALKDYLPIVIMPFIIYIIGWILK